MKKTSKGGPELPGQLPACWDQAFFCKVIEWLGIVCHLAQENKKHLLSRGCQPLLGSMHLATGTSSRRAAGDVCAAAKGRQASAHPVGFTWGDPAGTLFQLGRTVVIMCIESERGNNSDEVASDTTVLHLNTLSPTERQEASLHKLVFG